MTRPVGEDPAVFAIALESLALNTCYVQWAMVPDHGTVTGMTRY